jgi:hypothetical protein
MKKPVIILVVGLLMAFTTAGQSSVINIKGTRLSVDSS